MFELKVDQNGKKFLQYSDRKPFPGERGRWVEIGHQRERDINQYVELNRRAGLEVEIDEHGTYRALVLKD